MIKKNDLQITTKFIPPSYNPVFLDAGSSSLLEVWLKLSNKGCGAQTMTGISCKAYMKLMAFQERYYPFSKENIKDTIRIHTLKKGKRVTPHRSRPSVIILLLFLPTNSVISKWPHTLASE